MSKFDNWIDNKIVQNLFIWFFLFLILLTTIQGESRILTSLFAIFLIAPAVYISNLFILPFLRKKFFYFLALFITNTLFFTIISVFIIKIVAEQTLEFSKFVNFFGIMILALTFATAIKIARDSFTRRQQEKEAELKLLKAQLNPHFLFNTLNNLYGLSVIKSDKLPSLMLKLSDLLRYSLYQTKEAFVPLNKEVEYLENYISLEKIRLEEQISIKLNVSGNHDSKRIAPMLLIVFVENAFKHLGDAENEKNKVIIDIIVEEEVLKFTCKNTLDTWRLMEENIEKGKSGIGLINVKKRLSLLYFDKYELQIENKGAYFLVELILEL